MSDELTDFDEQLKDIIAEIRKSLEVDVPKAQGRAKVDKCDYLKNRLNRAKQLLKSLNVELRELSRADAKPWEDKSRSYDQEITKLNEDITWASSGAERDELFNNKGRNADEMTAKDLVDQAKLIQGESKASTGRAIQVMNQTLAVGVETSEALQKQTSQLNNVDKNLDDIENNLKRADKQIRIFLRRLATDKVIMTLVFIVIIGIITAVIISVTRNKIAGKKMSGPSDVIDTGRGLDNI